jgi:hypothetical protein
LKSQGKMSPSCHILRHRGCDKLPTANDSLETFMNKYLALLFTIFCLPLPLAVQAELKRWEEELVEIRDMGACSAAYRYIDFSERAWELDARAESIALSKLDKLEAYQVGVNYGAEREETFTLLTWVPPKDGSHESQSLDFIKQNKCNLRWQTSR